MKAYLDPFGRLLLAAVIVFLSACASMGVPSPQNFGEQLAVGISTVTEVRNSAGTLLVAKKISADDAQNVQTQADNARAALDVARSMRATDPGGAQTKLTTTITILQGLKAYLATRAK
jgi:hypothetical protein